MSKKETEEERVDYYIDQWHRGAGNDQSLQEFLGWTDDEYKKYVEHGVIPESSILKKNGRFSRFLNTNG